MNIIKVNNISKSFKATKVLDDVTCQFEVGKIHGIIGRNGAGKTLLMKAMCGFIIPDAGEIIIREMVLSKTHNTIPEDMGIMIENPGFIPTFSGYHNLQYLASIKKIISKEEIMQALSIVGLEKQSKKKVSQYSLGMRQRLGIAQAFMENQSIMILDEPMSGLDNRGVDEMRQLFIDLKKEGKTIILASHNREDIDVLCDTVIEMDRGKIIRREKLNKGATVSH